jgi:hypothetical protein
MNTVKFAKPSVFLILVLSLGALTCKGVAGFTEPFTTDTPIPSATLTDTPTPSPTLPPTITPTKPPSGTMKHAQPDGSTLFTDYDNKYELVFPAGWTAVTLTQDDINSMLTLASKNNPEFGSIVNMLQNLDPATFRIFAFDFRPGHLVNGVTVNIGVTCQANTLLDGTTLQNTLDATVQTLPQILSGAQVLSSKVTKNGTGIPIGVIELNMTFKNIKGAKVPAYEQLVIFKLPDVVVEITLATPRTLQTVLLPDFKKVIDSFKND